MDDSEYYAMMRKQYNVPVDRILKKRKPVNVVSHKEDTTFTQWNTQLGHEDAEMLNDAKSENSMLYCPPEDV